MLVADLMEIPQEIVRLHAAFRKAAEKFTRIDEDELSVVNQQGQLVGVLTRKRIQAAIHDHAVPDPTIESMMEKPQQVVEKTSALNTLHWDSNHRYMWVVNEERILVGVLNSIRLGQETESVDSAGKSYEVYGEKYMSLLNNGLFISILESSFDGIWIANHKGNTLYVNSAYERITGLKKEQLEGKNMRELLEEKLFEQSTVLGVLEKKIPVSVIHKYVTGRFALATGSPVFDQNEEIKLVVCNIRDISELLKMKNELVASKDLSKKYSHELLQLRQQQMKISKIICKSISMHHVLELSLKVAPFDSTVLIMGESGVGKEVIAKFIHKNSFREDAPFIKVNCAAIPCSLVESELFGYVKGSFTGANIQGKPGMFELANDGTILLDEIGELPLDVQAKLLRVIQEKEVFRIGAKEPTKLNVRLLASTNVDVQEQVHQKKFREDLFYRLNVFPIHIPPLRERKDDISDFIYHFLEKQNKHYKTQKTILPEIIELLTNYTWPGNVRELENLIEYLFIISPGNEIGIEQLPPHLIALGLEFDEENNPGPLPFIIGSIEKRIIGLSLQNHGSIRKTAYALGVDPSTLLRKMRKYHIKANA